MTNATKPLWIPILGYLVVVGSLLSLILMIASWMTGSPHVDLGFIGLWLGAGIIQYHWRSARIMAVLCLLGASLSLIFLFFVATGNPDLVSPDFFPQHPSGVRITAGLLGFISLTVLVSITTMIFRARRYFDNHTPKFHPRDIPRESIPPLMGCIVLVLLIPVGIQLSSTTKNEAFLEQIRTFELLFTPVDQETGESLHFDTSYRATVIRGPGVGRVYGMGGASGGSSRISLIGTVPLRGELNLSREGYEPVSREFQFTQGGRKTITVPMTKLPSASEPE